MRQVLILILIFCGIKSFSQDINKEIEKDFRAYHQLISERKIDEALNYSNPKLFELFPREQMKSLMEAIFKMPNLEYKTGVPTMAKFDELKKIDGVNYVRFYIKSPIEMKFSNLELTKEKLEMMMNNFEAKFGKGNVSYDQSTGFFKISADKIIIANSDDKKEDWKFVTVDNPNIKALLEKIIPKELLE